MKIKERQIEIVDFIRKHGRASVQELAELMGISRETIRRDLSDLAKSGKIQKEHGGATLPHIFSEGSFQQRMSNHTDEKIKIAKVAANLFSQGDTLFIDTGSTTLYFAEKLAEKENITVITNSTEIAHTISTNSNNTAYLLGGEFNPSNRQSVGTMVTAQAQLFRAQHTILTVSALDERTGAMDFNNDETQVARAMIAQSESVTLLIDSSKFNAVAAFKVCRLYKIDRIVCDSAPPKGLSNALQDANIEVIIANNT